MTTNAYTSITSNNGRLSASEIQEAIDKEHAKLFHITPSGEPQPLVCLVCDQFTGPKYKLVQSVTLEKNKDKLKVGFNQDVSQNILNYYQYKKEGMKPWMSECMLSPRGIYKPIDRRNKGFVVCDECHSGLTNQEHVPRKAIGNGWFFGGAPACIQELNDVELAIITPVKSFGYCFSYVGGKYLKGTLGYFKVQKTAIARTVSIATTLSEKLNQNVVCIQSGKMTDDQKARSPNTRPGKLHAAIEWMSEFCKGWHGINMADFNNAIAAAQPLIIDMTEPPDPVLQGETMPEEMPDTFSVYFPDGSMTNFTGGKESVSEFEKIVMEAQKQNFQGTLVTDLSREFTNELEGDDFAESCLLQMAYGRGGLKETRSNTVAGEVWNITPSEFADHCSYISIPAFHTPLFVLKLFNMKLRANMIKSAAQTLNGSYKIQNLRENLSLLDFQKACKARIEGSSVRGNDVSEALLKSLRTVNQALPHTDEAARRPRMWMECLQHQFVMGGFFLTVTPDDENTYLVTLYAGMNESCDIKNPETATLEEIKECTKERHEVRMKFPGIAALNFEYMLDIIIKVVIGWDMEKQMPTGVPGLFGIPLGFGAGAEEQGRTTLHIHIVVLLKGYSTYLENINSTEPRVQKSAKDHISSIVDDTMCTKLVQLNGHFETQDTYKTSARKAFDHDGCNCVLNKREPPKVVDDATLRFFRHREYHKESTTLAVCPHCEHKWSSEDLVDSYLQNVKQIPKFVHHKDTRTYLQQMCYQYTKPIGMGETEHVKVEPAIVHAKADLHASSHTKTCFKRQYSGCMYEDECRARLPEKKKRRTEVQPVSLGNEDDSFCPYFSWNGSKSEKKYFQVIPKRSQYDLFVNTYIPAVSESRIGGNSNGRVLCPGPIGMYTTKYVSKKTQKDDAEPYKNVVESITKLSMEEAKYQTQRPESLRILLRGAFAANKTSVVGAPMAAFLTRRGSRFVFSHKFSWIPMKDIMSLLTKGEVDKVYLKTRKGEAYADIQGMHYICRPYELECLCPKQFYEQYEIIGADARFRTDEMLDFVQLDMFEHPSIVRSDTGTVLKRLQVVRRRSKPHLAWIPYWDFGDTARFRGQNILTCEDITEDMEGYASNVLLLCSSFRCLNDLKVDDSFVKRLRMLYFGQQLDPYISYLQNIQDGNGNYLRVRPRNDELQLHTRPYKPEKHHDQDQKNDDSDDEESAYNALQGLAWDAMMDNVEACLEGADIADNGIYTPNYMPKKINIERIVNKGSHNCGKKQLCNVETKCSTREGHGSFVNFNSMSSFIREENNLTSEEVMERTPVIPRDLIRVLFQHSGTGGFRNIDTRPDTSITLPKANGSALSIVTWGQKAGLDNEQRRAFEVLTSSFVLSFYKEAKNYRHQDTDSRTRVHSYYQEQLKLVKLAGHVVPQTTANRPIVENPPNIICYIAGPAGSGKSAVIGLLLEYAKEFCGYLNQPFTRHTILVTGITGVAAALIDGETTCTALHLKKAKANITYEMKQAFKHTRMIIIDELSFAGRQLVVDVNHMTQFLKDNFAVPFGGVNMLFMGDFRQLQPPNKYEIPITKGIFQEFHGYVNTYIELYGRHRFINQLYGEMMLRFHEGQLTKEDVMVLNTRVVTDDTVLPTNIQYATHLNVDRAAINSGLFYKYCKTYDAQQRMEQGIENGAPVDLSNCIIILSSDLKVKNGDNNYVTMSDAWNDFFWSNVSEGDCIPAPYQGRFDPALMLHFLRSVMLNDNLNVLNKESNGTRWLVWKIIVEAGALDFISIGEYSVPAVKCDKVKTLVLKSETDPHKFIIVKPKEHTFTAKVPFPSSYNGLHEKPYYETHMKGIQFPIVCNNATTGHKLQGASIDNIFVHSNSKVINWMYVVCSRVRGPEGLYLRHKINEKDLDAYNKLPDGLRQMLEYFRRNKLQNPLTEEEYEAIFTKEEYDAIVGQL